MPERIWTNLRIANIGKPEGSPPSWMKLPMKIIGSESGAFKFYKNVFLRGKTESEWKTELQREQQELLKTKDHVRFFLALKNDPVLGTGNPNHIASYKCFIESFQTRHKEDFLYGIVEIRLVRTTRPGNIGLLAAQPNDGVEGRKVKVVCLDPNGNPYLGARLFQVMMEFAAAGQFTLVGMKL